MSSEAGKAAMKLSASFVIEPIGDIPGNIATVLGETLLVVLGLLYPPQICKKANIVVTELIQNVMENVSQPASAIRVDLKLDDVELLVSVKNSVTPEQFAAVDNRIRQLSSASDPKKLFADTLRARRVHRLKGGLGLMRLVSENKFRLSTEYADGLLTVSARFALRGVV